MEFLAEVSWASVKPAWAVDDLEGLVDGGAGGGVFGEGGHGEGAGFAELGELGVGAVAVAALDAELGVEERGKAAADEGIDDVEGAADGVGGVDAEVAHGEVGLGGVWLVDEEETAAGLRFEGGGWGVGRVWGPDQAPKAVSMAERMAGTSKSPAMARMALPGV